MSEISMLHVRPGAKKTMVISAKRSERVLQDFTNDTYSRTNNVKQSRYGQV